MARKRPLVKADVTEASTPSIEPPPLSTAMPPSELPRQEQQQYFRYELGPEPDDGWNGCEEVDINQDTSRYLRRAYFSRNRHQREVDKVDIPAPVEWLCHDAASSARLRARAQKDLQLFVPRPPYHLPHSARQERWSGDIGIRAAVHSTLNYSTGNCSAGHMRPERVIRGGDVLPWGSWPARLRHHEGQSFYRDPVGEGSGGSSSGGDVGRSSPGSRYWVGGSGVGRNGGVGGVGAVSEGSIHDELLRREFPSSSCGHEHHEEAAVTRLVPDKRGRWVEAKPKRSPPTTLAAGTAAVAASASGSEPASSPVGSPPPEPPPPPPPAAPMSMPSSTAEGEVVKALLPARYGGWVEFQMNEKDSSTVATRKRRAAVAMAARFGPDGGGDEKNAGVVPDAALPSSYQEEEEYVRRMVAGTTTRKAGRQQREQEGTRRQHGVLPSLVEEGDQGGGGVATARADGRRRKRSWDTACSGVGAERGDDDHGDRSGCHRQGWTVSEPAKETVRRVWNRARRRARDSFEPRNRAHEFAVDAGEEEGAASRAAGTTATAAAGCGTAREELDPGLLSCLGRECEGILDAALHVVLGDRLRRLRAQSSSSLSKEDDKRKNSPPPPPLETADWQDVLRAMARCSEGARGTRPPAATAAAFRSKAADAHGAGHIEGGGGGGVGGGGKNGGMAGGKAGEPTEDGEGIPGRVAMEKAVWGGGGDSSDGSVVVVNERLPGLPLNEAVLTRSYNRLLLYLHEKKAWQA